MNKVDQVLDAKDLACPMPIVRTKKAMNTLEVGQVLEVQTTDKGSINDIAAWTKSSGHLLIESKEENGVFTFLIRKAGI